MENLYMPNCVRTVSGKYVNVVDPQPETICIEDIAHGLANVCRFGGHTQTFYSVARHSVDVCLRVPPYLRLAALLHDASEAYLGDIPSPIKKRLPDYQALENKFMQAIAVKFRFDFPLDPIIKEIDRNVLQIEWDNAVLKNGSGPEFKELAAENFIYIFNVLKR